MEGIVYLLCFAPGLHVTGNRFASHYIGWTSDVTVRYERHLNGQGSPLVKAAVKAGLEVRVARTFQGKTREFERALKSRHDAPRLCPFCSEKPLTPGLCAKMTPANG